MSELQFNKKSAAITDKHTSMILRFFAAVRGFPRTFLFIDPQSL